MRLESGNNYSVSQLFCGENDKIIIPDLQRDYCWGNPENNLVEGFVKGLLEMDHSQEITMGLIYGYYDKFTPCHLQLCDGQQRLTTIFLILGILNRKLGFNEYKLRLMSSFELENDDKEPYLQYAVRESSLYFLSDLAVYYFLQAGIASSEEIPQQSWFLNEYRVDPTVQSILNAIKTIEDCFDGIDNDKLTSLGDFIVSKLNFLFYDMENRENGEETFVIINTTGEPLSATQNLKPLIIDWNRNWNKEKYPNVAQDWEEMETWFWRNRNRQGTEYPHTADEGMNCFLNVVRLLHCKTEEESYKTIDSKDKFPYKDISFREVYEDFKIYAKLYGMDFSERYDKKISYPSKQQFYEQNRLYAILPTMRYCLHFKDAENEDIKRIYHIFSNMARYRKVYRSENDGKLYSPVHRAIEMIDKMETKDIASLTKILANIENGEETSKIEFAELYKNSPKERKEVELLMAIAENHYVFNGRINTMLKWSQGRKNEFIKYYNKFVEYWGDKEGNRDLDLLRRALLTRNLHDYPRQFGGKNYSFCLSGENWQELINDKENEQKFKSFFDDLLMGDSEQIMNKMIEDYPNNNQWAEFIKREYLLRYCKQKNIQWDDQEQVWLLIKKERRSGDYMHVYTRHLGNYLNNELSKQQWKFRFWKCLLVVENSSDDYVFDIYYNQSKWVFQFFRRNHEVKNDLQQYVDDTWNFNGERYVKAIDFENSVDYVYPNVKKLLDEMMSQIAK